MSFAQILDKLDRLEALQRLPPDTWIFDRKDLNTFD